MNDAVLTSAVPGGPWSSRAARWSPMLLWWMKRVLHALNCKGRWSAKGGRPEASIIVSSEESEE